MWFENNVLQPQVLLACAAMLLLSTGFTVIKKRHLLSAILFGVMGLLMTALCVIRAIVWSDLVDAESATVMYRAYYVVVCAGSCVMFHFCNHELSIRQSHWLILVINWQIGLWIAFGIIGSDLMIEGVVEAPWGFEPSTQVASVLVLFWILAQLAFVIGNCVRVMRERLPGSQDWRRLRGLMLLMLSLIATMIEPAYHAYGIAYPVMPIVMTGSVLAGVFYVWRFGLNKLPAEQMARQIFERLPHAAMHADIDGAIVNVNQRARLLFAGSTADLEGRHLTEILNPALTKDLLSDLAELKEGETDYPLDTDDTPLREKLLLSVDANLGPNDLPKSWIVTLKTAQKEASTRADHRVDPITGLSSRSSFSRLVEAALIRTQMGNECASVLMMGIASFSRINEVHGYEVGDKLLSDVGARFRRVLAERGAAARTGGDEFGCLLVHNQDYPLVPRVRGELMREMARPFTLSNGATVQLDVYFGADNSIQSGSEAVQLLRAAQLNLHRNNPEYAASNESRSVSGSVPITDELATALSRGEFKPHYQAVLDLERRAVVGFHTLLRWYHPDGSIRVAADFLNTLQRSGMMKEAEHQLHEQMLKDAPHLIRAAGESADLKLYFKIDNNALMGSEWERRFGRFACDHPDLTRHLAFELSESDAMLAKVREAMEFFSELGYGVSLDQFGSAYSALSELARMPLTGLCIDRHFVRGTMLHAQSRLLVEGIAEMAGDLGLSLIAKGVSVPAEARQLARHGCQLQQGTLYSPPLASQGAIEVLQDQGELLQRWVRLPETRLYQGQGELA